MTETTKQAVPENMRDMLSALGHRLRGEFDEAERGRRDTEQRWLDNIRQYKGKYSSAFLASLDPNQSRVFVKETRKKVRTVDSRLRDMLFPANSDRNWAIDATPEPELDQEDLQQIALSVQEGADEQELTDAIAKERAEALSLRVDDQLVEMRYSEIVGRDVIHSASVYGTGIVKGPLSVVEEDGSLKPYAEHVPVWAIYPDMDATTLDDCRYVFQRHVMARHDVLALAKRDDFEGEVILDYLKATNQGDATLLEHEQELRELGKNNQMPSTPKNRYELLEYWGAVTADEMRECGCETEEETDFWANVWMMGPFVIKAAMTPLEKIDHPYHFFYVDKDETSIFGDGIPSLMDDDQEILNAGTRAMLDNAAITAGFQLEANLDLLDAGEDHTDIHPFKVWARRGDGEDAKYPALREIGLKSYTKEYLSLIQTAERWGSEHTVPSYMHGDEKQNGAAETMGGLSMLMGATNIEFKDLVRNFDNGITKPFIRAMSEWNQQVAPDQGIRGDHKIRARGSSALVAKELRAQQLDNFAASVNNPTDAPWINRGELNRNRSEAHDLGDEIVYTDEQHAKNLEGQGPSMEDKKLAIEEMLAATEAELKQAKAATERIKTMQAQIEAAYQAGDAQTAIAIDQAIQNDQRRGVEPDPSNPGNTDIPGMGNALDGADRGMPGETPILGTG